MLNTTSRRPKKRHTTCYDPPWTNTADILRKTSTDSAWIHSPTKMWGWILPFPSKPACICQNRHDPKASLKFCRSCRALLFPPSKPHHFPLNLKSLCTSSLGSREPVALPQPADSHCKKKEKEKKRFFHCWLWKNPFYSLVKGFRAVNDTGFKLGI